MGRIFCSVIDVQLKSLSESNEGLSTADKVVNTKGGRGQEPYDVGTERPGVGGPGGRGALAVLARGVAVGRVRADSD